MPEALDPSLYRALVRGALAEDVGSGDVTTRAIVPADRPGIGVFVAKAPIVLAGLDVARVVFAEVDADVRFHALQSDGDACAPGTRIAEIQGRAASLLIAERTALNLLQALSGIATVTRAYVEAAAGGLRVLDTRKTAPMQRHLAKYAVRCGGGSNKRIGLFDGVLIKDNHIRVAGSVHEAIRRVRASAAGPGFAIEVEVQDLAQLDEALAAGAEIILLDNMDDVMTSTAIARVAGRARIELTGNMTLERVHRLAGSGADDVSVGALTHSAPAADISLEIDL